MSAYTNSVDHYLQGIDHVSSGPAPGCPDCLECDNPDDPSNDWYDLASEGSFSWRQCDSCGSTFGGDRFDAHGMAKLRLDSTEKELIHFNVCVDCLVYLADGDEPEEWQRTP